LHVVKGSGVDGEARNGQLNLGGETGEVANSVLRVEDFGVEGRLVTLRPPFTPSRNWACAAVGMSITTTNSAAVSVFFISY